MSEKNFVCGICRPDCSLAIGHDDAGRRGEWAAGWKSDGLAWPDWLADPWPAGFRLVWGVLGSTYARFLQFFPTPSRIRAYLSGEWQARGTILLERFLFCLAGAVDRAGRRHGLVCQRRHYFCRPAFRVGQ